MFARSFSFVSYGMIKGYIIAGLVLVAMVASCCILKQINTSKYGPRWWNRQQRKEDKRPKPESFDVVSVPSGNTIKVKAGRRDKTITITLGGIGVPSEYADESRANLEKMVGSTIKAEVPRRRLRLDPPYQREDGTWIVPVEYVPGHPVPGYSWTKNKESGHWGWEQNMSEPRPNPPEARSDFTSPLVLGDSGLCLQLEQLKAGMAMPNTSDIPDEWMAATKYAQDNKLGLWATTPIPPEPVKSKWASRFTWYAVAVFVFLLGWFAWSIYTGIRKAKEGAA